MSSTLQCSTSGLEEFQSCCSQPGSFFCMLRRTRSLEDLKAKYACTLFNFPQQVHSVHIDLPKDVFVHCFSCVNCVSLVSDTIGLRWHATSLSHFGLMLQMVECDTSVEELGVELSGKKNNGKSDQQHEVRQFGYFSLTNNPCSLNG